MQKNDYLLAKFGVDTAENEPLRARLRARLNIGYACASGEDTTSYCGRQTEPVVGCPTST